MPTAHAKPTARPFRGWAIVIDEPGCSPELLLVDVPGSLPAPRLYRNPHEANRDAGAIHGARVVEVILREEHW
ncbi:hypothetical protein [Thalassoglobus sp.]|uniref:hypothetical protein n=1 Tax=Thalassoglobus sp. TaxID=2795869 RepID=UPI003AA878C1